MELYINVFIGDGIPIFLWSCSINIVRLFLPFVHQIQGAKSNQSRGLVSEIFVNEEEKGVRNIYYENM